jgi:hypothetical protein
MDGRRQESALGMTYCRERRAQDEIEHDLDALVWVQRTADIGEPGRRAAQHPLACDGEHRRLTFEHRRNPLLERAFLAAAIHHRYTKAQPRHAEAYLRLLNEEQQASAAALGAALRFGAHLCGRSATLLGSFQIAVVDDRLLLRVKKKVAHLVTDTAVRRLEAAAQALGLGADVKVMG